MQISLFPVELNTGSFTPAKSSVQFSCSVMSDSLWPHGLQQARPPCPSPTPRVYSNSCPLSQWCHPTIFILCCPLLLLPSIFPTFGVFSNDSALCIRCPKYWSFSFNISPSKNIHGWFPSGWTGWFSLLSILISACASSSPAFLMMSSAQKLNKQGSTAIFFADHFVLILEVRFWKCLLTLIRSLILPY